MLRFNTFRSKRYLRSKFVEGRFLLASEASDIELEIIDLIRQSIQATLGDVAIADAWEVTKVSDTQLLVKAGEAWFKGLPFTMRSGKDALVSGASLTPGLLPVGVSITDDPNGAGKLITFNDSGTTPTGEYRIIVSAREELIDSTEDEFLQNANLTEDTAQKVRVNLKIDIVLESAQESSPIPYTNDTTDQNLVNEIVVTPTASGNGELVSSTAVPGSEKIDGRDLELVLRNDPALGGGNPIPNGITDQQAFSQGKLIDSKGETYHIVAVFNDVVSTQVVLRLDKEIGQQDPEIINALPIVLKKRDVYVSDDVNGNPLGKLFWPVAKLDWNETSGFTHESKITDLRTSKTRADELESKVSKKFNLKLTDGGSISFKDTTLAPATGTITIVDNTFSSGDGVVVDGTSFVNGVDFTVGIDTDATAGDLATAIDALPNVSAVAVGSVVTVTAITSGEAGNLITLARIDADSLNFELSGNTLSGGADDIPGELSWSSPFTLINPHGSAMTVASASLPILEGGSLSYELDLSSGGAIEKGTIAVNVTSAGATVSLDPVALSTAKVGNLLKVGTEVVEITAIDDVNDTLTVSPALVGTGSGEIILDSFASGTVPTDLDFYTLAVRQGGKVYVGGQLELENKETTELGDGISEQLLAYIGATGEDDSKPQYSSTSVVDQGVDLTTAIGQLDSAIGPISGTQSQDRNIKLIAGGTWSWNQTAGELTLSADAYLQVPGLTNDRNTIQASTITIGAGQVAYVSMNRIAGATANLTVQVADIDAVGLTSATVVIARRDGNDVIVGSSSFRLKDREFLELDGALAEINRYHGQLKVSPSLTPDTKVSISGADITKLDGSKLSLEQKNLLLQFDGVVIDFATGEVFESDGTTPFLGGANDFTPTTITANEFFYYSISLLPNTANADNTISGQILVIPASGSNAVLSSAPKAPFPSTGIKLCNVHVQEDGASSILAIDYANIIQLGVGGSGSGGTGDANELLERLKNRLDLGEYEVVTPVIFASSEEELTDPATTASYDITSSTYEFDAIGKQFTSVEMLDSQFLSEGKDVADVELAVYWDLATLDPLATYEVSRDGGNEFQAVSLDRIGNSDTYFGRHVFAEEATLAEIIEQAVTDSLSVMTDTVEKRAQAFTVAQQTTMKKLTVRGNVTGFATMQGGLIVQIVNDDSSLPSTDSADILFESPIQDLSSFGADGDVDIEIPMTVPLGAGTYHIVYKTSLAYRSNYASGITQFAIRTDSAGSPSASEFTTSWASGTGALMYKLEGRALGLQVRITAGTADTFLSGFGVFYDRDNSFSLLSRGYDRQLIQFSGSDNTDTFAITEFVPDPILMDVYELETGQVYRRGAWSLDGTTVVFPANTFDKPGETITLEFLQVFEGSLQFDSTNRTLLAQNHIGSTDPSLDLSANGRGIFLRRPDGTLREITINDNDDIDVFSV